jgi:hypothetical protein
MIWVTGLLRYYRLARSYLPGLQVCHANLVKKKQVFYVFSFSYFALSYLIGYGLRCIVCPLLKKKYFSTCYHDHFSFKCDPSNATSFFFLSN